MQDNNGPSAGYHGYWITDFTQIDPHLGTNDDLRGARRGARTRTGMKVYFDIITNHTADVIRYAEGAAPVYKSKDESPYRTAAGTPFDDRDYAGGSTFPALAPTRQLPATPRSAPDRASRATQRQGARWLNDVTSTTTAATRPSPARTRSTATSSGSTTSSPRTPASSTA